MINKALRLGERPILKRIVQGGIWSVVGEIGTRVFPFITAIVIARLLGVADFGGFAMIQATAGAFSVIGGFGLGNTATKYVAEYRYTDPEKASKVIALTLFVAGLTGIIAALSLCLSADMVATKVLAKASLSLPLSWASPMLFFTALVGAMSGILLGLEKTKVLAKLSTVASCINSLLIVIGIYYFDLIGGAIAIMFGSLIHMVLAFYVVKIEVFESGLRIYSGDFIKERNLIWGFSLPSTLATMMHIPIIWFAQAIIANQPSGYDELGLYNAAVKWQTVVIFLPMAFSAIYLPVLSSVSSGGNYNKFLKTTNKLALLNLTAVLPVVLIVYFFTDTAMSIFGEGFVSGKNILSFMLVLSVINLIYRIYWQALISIGKVWVIFWLSFSGGVLMLCLTWLFKSSGGVALVYSMSISGMIALVFQVYLLHSWKHK